MADEPGAADDVDCHVRAPSPPLVGLFGRLSPWWGPGIALASVALVGSAVGEAAVVPVLVGSVVTLGALLVLAWMRESRLLPLLSVTWTVLALLLAAALLH